MSGTNDGPRPNLVEELDARQPTDNDHQYIVTLSVGSYAELMRLVTAFGTGIEPGQSTSIDLRRNLGNALLVCRPVTIARATEPEEDQ